MIELHFAFPQFLNFLEIIFTEGQKQTNKKRKKKQKKKTKNRYISEVSVTVENPSVSPTFH